MVNKKNQINITCGKLENMNGDVALNWATHSFTHGNENFYSLITKSGLQPLEAIKTFQANIEHGELKESDVLSTIAGLLKFNLLLHCLVSDHMISYNFAWMNIIKTLKTYKSKNVCRNLYLTIPSWRDLKNFITEFNNYQKNIEEINFVFVVNNEAEKSLVQKWIEQICPDLISHKSFMDKVDSFLLNRVKKMVANRTNEKVGESEKEQMSQYTTIPTKNVDENINKVLNENKIVIDNVQYNSISDAANKLKLSTRTISNRIKKMENPRP